MVLKDIESKNRFRMDDGDGDGKENTGLFPFLLVYEFGIVAFEGVFCFVLKLKILRTVGRVFRVFFGGWSFGSGLKCFRGFSVNSCSSPPETEVNCAVL